MRTKIEFIKREMVLLSIYYSIFETECSLHFNLKYSQFLGCDSPFRFSATFQRKLPCRSVITLSDQSVGLLGRRNPAVRVQFAPRVLVALNYYIISVMTGR